MEFDELRSRFYFVRKRFHEAERWQKNSTLGRFSSHYQANAR
jgi:hypothetical protein